jgi:hypothetical protein
MMAQMEKNKIVMISKQHIKQLVAFTHWSKKALRQHPTKLKTWKCLTLAYVKKKFEHVNINRCDFIVTNQRQFI